MVKSDLIHKVLCYGMWFVKNKCLVHAWKWWKLNISNGNNNNNNNNNNNIIW